MIDMTPQERLEAAFRRRYGHSPKAIGEHFDGRPILSMRGGAEHLYYVQNSTIQTTAAPVKQPTGAAIRTMLQIECGPADPLTIVEWGISFDGSAAATPGQVELLTNTVAATMSTALAATDVTLYNQPADTSATSAIVYGGTTHSGFATAAVTEASAANVRNLDIQQIAPTNGYVKQWPLGREPQVPVAKFVRVRVTFGTTVNAYIYVIWAE
jgi:hypothetical protein